MAFSFKQDFVFPWMGTFKCASKSFQYCFLSAMILIPSVFGRVGILIDFVVFLIYPPLFDN